GLEGNAADRMILGCDQAEHLAADLEHHDALPLHDACGSGQAGAELIDLFGSHRTHPTRRMRLMRCSVMTDWRPDKLARRLPFLQVRAHIQAALRGWFAREGFVEVETPILQVSPGAEVHLHGFATDWETPDGEDEQVRWLHSSPEFAMKKLLAG